MSPTRTAAMPVTLPENRVLPVTLAVTACGPAPMAIDFPLTATTFPTSSMSVPDVPGGNCPPGPPAACWPAPGGAVVGWPPADGVRSRTAAAIAAPAAIATTATIANRSTRCLPVPARRSPMGVTGSPTGQPLPSGQSSSALALSGQPPSGQPPSGQPPSGLSSLGQSFSAQPPPLIADPLLCH